MKSKLYTNTFFSLGYQILTIVVGLILPRVILSTYGSEVNGLVSSVTQMLGFISLLDLGVGAVVQAALYKPLSDKDNYQISLIYTSAQRYFKIIARVLIIYILFLCFYYSEIQKNIFSSIDTITLILSISISSFAQYYFGICNTLLINADQKIYVTTIVNMITLFISTIVSLILMFGGFSIQVMKFASSFIFLGRPLFLTLYVKKYYNLVEIENVPKNVLPQQWNGLAQHVATVLTAQIDYMVLTFFSTLKSISIYNIYTLPLTGIRLLIESISSSYKSFFGKLIADNKYKELYDEFEKYEIFMHYIVIIIFSCSAIVIVPFVLLYTNSVVDVNYNQPIFAYIITLSYAIFALRIPYTTIIFSAGHFKQTQQYCIIESFLNVFLSIVFVKYFGLSGAALGTCIAVVYRMCISAYYLQKNILKRRYIVFLKYIFLDCLSVLLIFMFSRKIQISEITVMSWIVYSLKVFLICLVITSFVYATNKYLVKNK